MNISWQLKLEAEQLKAFHHVNNVASFSTGVNPDVILQFRAWDQHPEHHF